MRVLVTVNDAFGHVLPLVPTVHALAQRGHDVLLACPGPTARQARRPGIEIREYEPVLVAPLREAPPRSDRATRLAWSVRVSWPNDARGWAAALLDDARVWRPDVVVVEPVEHAGRIAAAALEVPLVEHGWGFTLPADVDQAAGAGLADVYAAVGAVARPPDLRVDLGHHDIQAGDGPPAVERYRYVPWSPSAVQLSPPDRRPRVLVTLGTVAHPDAALRLRAAAQAATALGAEVIVAVGNRDRLDGGAWPAGGRTSDWMDLPAEVARCALVVHHGGAGTSWASLAAGVPAVCLPQAGDQFRNAELLARAGAALVIQPEDADQHTLRTTIVRAFEDPSMSTAARRAQRDNAALPGPDELATRLELCVAGTTPGRVSDCPPEPFAVPEGETKNMSD
jgi:UDP:flavonoid glycosyltransferase YjiC (YdhE family)